MTEPVAAHEVTGHADEPLPKETSPAEGPTPEACFQPVRVKAVPAIPENGCQKVVGGCRIGLLFT